MCSICFMLKKCSFSYQSPQEKGEKPFVQKRKPLTLGISKKGNPFVDFPFAERGGFEPPKRF